MELNDTIEMMTSKDYKERFIAEYHQTKIRYEKLHKTIVKYEAGTLNFTPTCSIELLKMQERAMEDYLYVLEVRAEIEEIEVGEINLESIDNYEENLKRIYNSISNRIKETDDILADYESNQLDSVPNGAIETLKTQKQVLLRELGEIEDQAKLQNIEL